MIFKCFVLVKMYGNTRSCRKLFVVKMNEFPLFSFHFLWIVFISLYNLFSSRFIIMLFRGGIKFLLGSVVVQ